MNLVTIDRTTFNRLSDDKLGWECMEPTFMLIRGKSPAVKAGVLAQLSRGQHALCMFRIMYDHAHKSAPEYYAWLSYILAIPGYWDSVIEGIGFFDESGLVPLLEETKAFLELRNRGLGVTWGDALLSDLERDQELRQTIDSFYERFQQIAPITLSIIAGYIRTHPEEYVQLTD